MKKKAFLSAMFLLYILAFTANAQRPKAAPVYVIVHGAWGGGWAFKAVDSLLTARGCVVYRPTLTGQGERVHLATADVDLETHIMDVVNTLLFEGLRDAVLVGHSYAGMVVTGVADRVPERISHLIYMDAVVPEDGESYSALRGDMRDRGFNVVDGTVIPHWVDEGQAPPMDVPHPLKTMTDTLFLSNPLRLEIPTDYILTVEAGTAPETDAFAPQADRARQKGWPVHILTADHNPQWSAPVNLADMLLEISGH